MSRRARPDHAQRCIWSGITRETEITPLMMTYESDEWRVQGSEDSESDSDSEYQDVSLPVATVMPLVVPVTGESFCQCPVQAEVTYDPSLGLLPHDCLCGEDEIGCDWVWDESCKSSAAFLSCSNKKVSFHTEYSCGTAAIRGSKELSDGQHFWEIKMTSPVYGTDMMVGIGTSAVNVDQFKHNFCSLLGADGDSWGLSYTGLLHHKGSKVSFSPRFGQGSIIGVHLDSWHGTLTFYKNRRCIGVAARQLQNKRLYPMVCSTAAKSSMKVIRSCSVPTSLLYLCSLRLRQLLPDCTDVLTALALPPGLRMLLHVRLGWVLSLDSTAEAVGEWTDDGESCSSPDSYSETLSCEPKCCPEPVAPFGIAETPTTDTDDDSDSDGSASDPETCQRKRCRWT